MIRRARLCTGGVVAKDTLAGQRHWRRRGPTAPGPALPGVCDGSGGKAKNGVRFS
jgi:hypothetical protein